jgi:hypothetical protein
MTSEPACRFILYAKAFPRDLVRVGLGFAAQSLEYVRAKKQVNKLVKIIVAYW